MPYDEPPISTPKPKAGGDEKLVTRPDGRVAIGGVSDESAKRDPLDDYYTPDPEPSAGPVTTGSGRSSSGSSSSGGGSSGPVYVAPDRAMVEEFVRDKMIVMTGRKRAGMDKIVDEYIKNAKLSWEGKSIDPKQRAIDAIRDTSFYKRVHRFRPDSAEEDSWVSDRVTRLTQLGLNPDTAASRGELLASQGTGLADINTAAFSTGEGLKDIGMFQQIRRSAEQMSRLI